MRSAGHIAKREASCSQFTRHGTRYSKYYYTWKQKIKYFFAIISIKKGLWLILKINDKR